MAMVDRSLREVLGEFAAGTPTPGGGSAAAVAGALGASLLLMVASLPRKDRPQDDQLRLREAAQALEMLRGKLMEFIDLDAAAFDAVLSSYRMPKTTPEEQYRRRAAVQWSLGQALDVPLNTMRACRRALLLAGDVARLGNRSATADVEVALELLTAALRGARLNVEANLQGLDDDGRSDAVQSEIGNLTYLSERDVEHARECLKT
jgi:methenyltetrahydrofolate cyclohydrolase